MQSWRNGLGFAVGLVLVVGACSSVERIAAPDGARYEERQAPPADSTGYAPHDEARGDTTGGRWSGYLGGGSR
jgi:hypothetical protein